MKAPAWLWIRCQHAHELISARMDHAPVSVAERMRLWLHLRLCDFCARIEKQMNFTREALRRMDR